MPVANRVVAGDSVCPQEKLSMACGDESVFPDSGLAAYQKWQLDD
jgi:hypothetical protein